MRIESIKAQAFGPLSGEALEFSPGMNVVHGPNESGKSSWHAAIYVGLCGMRHTRGRATREDQAFTDRYRPWRGASWKVTERIVLDSGKVVQLEHSLGAGGKSTAIDPDSRRSLTAELLREDGALDGAALLGLTREAALATLFVRQADVLRVLADAGQLQKFLERAAATSAIDTTAEEAMARVATYKREWVGLLHANSRGPLAAATVRQKKARLALEVAEERYETYQDQVEQRRAAETALAKAEEAFEKLQHHEVEREVREQWLVIGDAQRRLHQARKLVQQLSEGPHDSGSRELVAEVTRAIALFDDRPPAPAALEGASAEQLEAELATLPRRPTGDLEPAEEVAELFDACRQALQRLRAHAENEPAVGSPDELPTASAAELRRIADDLEAPLPQVDREPDAPTRLTPVRLPSPVRANVPPAAGLIIGVAGAVLAAALQPIVGAVVLIAGIVLFVMGLMSRSRVRRGPDNRRVQPSSAAQDPHLARSEARRVLQEEALSLVQHRREAAVARVAALRLPVHPNLLRQMAVASEMSVSARGQVAGWERRRAELEQSLAIHAEQLRSALADRGIRIERNERLDQAFHRYTEACRVRMQATQVAGRADDLKARIITRREAEAGREEDKAARTRAVRQLRAVGLKAGCQASSPAEMADALRTWLDAETELDEHRQASRQMDARLDQLLDGRSIEELETDIELLIAKAGGSPPPTTTPLEDRSAELEAIGLRAGVLREQAAQLSGQLDSAEGHVLDVSEALEEDAWAETEVRSLTSLGDDLDLVASILSAAKEKVHGDIAPVLNETIRPWVPLITQGHYDDVRVNPATLEVEVHEVGGQFHVASLLSQGTAEQLFLLLRLALATHLATTGESAPLILDDVTVQSDTGRTTAMLDLLLELSRDHQVVLFTQEDAVRLWATERLVAPTGRLIELRRQ